MQKNVTNDVDQRTVLCPLLWIYIKDHPSVIKSNNVKLFAGDTKLPEIFNAEAN